MRLSRLGPFLFLGFLACTPATLHAQLPKIFVASFGNDANDGSRGNPKRNFQAAHDAVAAKGQIVVLDTAGYGPVNITKSIGIIVPLGVTGFITVTGNGAKAINIAAAVTDVITLVSYTPLLYQNALEDLAAGDVTVEQARSNLAAQTSEPK